MNPIIAVSGLTKRYGDRIAVEDVGFAVAPGEIVGLLGPNGAGKTTILECLCGLRQADQGSLSVGGVNVITQPARARLRLGVVLQGTALPDRITPREALRLFGAYNVAALSPAELLARFSLAEKADEPYESLSAGLKQRLALALAFIHRPDVLLLDEPTAGLDPQSRRELHREIQQLRTEGRTVLLSTHLLEEAHVLCDRLIILRGGKVVATGHPEELIARRHRAIVMFLKTGAPVSLAELQALPGVMRVEVAEMSTRLEVGDVGQAISALVELLEQCKIELVDLRVTQPSLEDAFIELTRAEGSS